MPQKNNALIVLLHGILRSKTDMLFLSNHFQKRGYKTLNILYPSREKDLQELSKFVHDKITEHPDAKTIEKIHFVTHSMGGLITRYYIHEHRPDKLGKVVMLSPPNSGSEAADFLKANTFLAPIFENLFGPAGQQLSTDYEHNLSDIDFPLGIIGGNKSINPFAHLALEGEHDGIVPTERMKINGMQDFIILPVTHSLMMFDKTVIKQAEYFLEYGKFEHAKAA